MYKTQAKIDNLSTAEWQQYHQLLANRRVVEYFSTEIERFSHTALKPDDVLRRFSLNGDGQLDIKEFQLALKRLGILQLPASSDSPAQQQQIADALMKARELYSVFCPSQTKKLEIDMFCRIMTEWSLQLIRARRDQQQQQQQQSSSQQQQQPSRPSSNSNSSRRYGVQPSYKSFDQYATGAVLAAPYATETSRDRNRSSRNAGAIPSSLHDSPSGHNGESDAIWRRVSDAIAQSRDKLRQIFFKMDIACTGSVSRDEFELGLSHIGVFLTTREYERVYDSLAPELKDYDAKGDSNSATFAIKYADFLALFHGQSPLVLPSTSKQASPPVAGVGNARLWDLLVQSIDRLEPLCRQLVRIQQHYVSPETFRDCLARCGLALSNADYAALRVRLLPFTDSATGAIGLTPLLQALHASDSSSMTSLAAGASSIATPSTRAVDVSPIRTGRRTNFQAAYESRASPLTHHHQQQQQQYTLSSSAPHAAGKSNEQRNVEANRTAVKIRDESRWKSDSTLYGNPDATGGSMSATATTGVASPHYDDDPMFAHRPAAPLETRILRTLAQMKALGQLGTASLQSIFPGDRFGRITRGQFRQSLVHLSVLARYAEVESLFWLLDPTGRGYIVALDLYHHLNAFATRDSSDDSASALPLSGTAGRTASNATMWNTLPAINTESSSPSGEDVKDARRLPRSAQKVLERMLLELPHLLAVCERNDSEQTGMVAPQELLTATQEVGILASTGDLQSAIFTIYSGMDDLLTRPADGSPPTLPYRRLEARLGQLCSDLLSPKKRKMHLSTTSVLLAPHEQSYDEQLGGRDAVDLHTVSETDALWNCPRRKMNRDHRATKSTFRIADHVADDVGLVQTRLAQSVPKSTMSSYNNGSATASRSTNDSSSDMNDRSLRKNRLAIIGILHDLLERRVDLKTAVDMHRNADVHGQVSTDDVAEILLTSRLGLHFATSSSGGISAREFVETLYPPNVPHGGITYLDLLHRASELLAALKRVTPATSPGYQRNNAHQQQRQTARRLNSNVAIGIASSPTASSMHSQQRVSSDQPYDNSFSNDEMSVRRKLLNESRLRDLLDSDSGRQSAAILVRHAFKGLAPREMVVPIDSGEFETTCRTSDLKHVCYRLGLDLDLSEQQFVAFHVDSAGVGFVSSPQLLAFLSRLALAAESSTAEAPAAASTRSLPEVTKHGQLRGYKGIHFDTSSTDSGDSSCNSRFAPQAPDQHQYSQQLQQQQKQMRESWNPVQAG